jgi:hypothetical protein
MNCGPISDGLAIVDDVLPCPGILAANDFRPGVSIRRRGEDPFPTMIKDDVTTGVLWRCMRDGPRHKGFRRTQRGDNSKHPVAVLVTRHSWTPDRMGPHDGLSIGQESQLPIA